MKHYLALCVLCALMLTAGIDRGGVVTAADQPAPAQPAGFTGIWTGTLRVFPCLTLIDRGRCGAVNDITFSIIDDGSNISGTYTCAIGTQICRNGNADKSGSIVSGKSSGNNIRFSVVVSADATNCQYTGFSSSPGQMRGAYTCYNGGSLAEQGSFQVTREGG